MLEGNVMKNKIDTELIEKSVKNILIALGEDINREGIIETPKRVAKMYQEIFEGMCYSNHDIAEMFNRVFTLDDEIRVNEQKNVVIERDITMFSFCEHHIALMYDMKVTVAYIPIDRVIGLSKIIRIVQMVGKRLQLQERIGADIADIIQEITGTEDIAVIITGKHSCVTTRGIKDSNAVTKTMILRGNFLEEPMLLSQYNIGI